MGIYYTLVRILAQLSSNIFRLCGVFLLLLQFGREWLHAAKELIMDELSKILGVGYSRNFTSQKDCKAEPSRRKIERRQEQEEKHINI